MIFDFKILYTLHAAPNAMATEAAFSRRRIAATSATTIQVFPNRRETVACCRLYVASAIPGPTTCRGWCDAPVFRAARAIGTRI